MTSKLKIAKRVIKEEGILILFKKGYMQYIRPVVLFPLTPYYYFKIKKTEFKDIREAFDFISDSHSKYLSSMQHEVEIMPLLGLVKKVKPKTMLEIGTARGGTLFLFSRTLTEEAEIIGLDLPAGGFGDGYPWWKIPLYKSFARGDQKITLVRKNSHKEETLIKIQKILDGKKLDFLFIDADHTYEGVKKDFQMYKDLVRKGGMIAFHDIVPNSRDEDCKVDIFWNEIKHKYKYQEFVRDWNQIGAGIGVIEV